MSVSRKCSFYRDSENLAKGMGIGYCDLKGNQTICDGDIKFCENPDALSRVLLGKESKGNKDHRDEEGQKEKSPKCRVLVIDNEEPIRQLVVTFLSSRGYQCTAASNGFEALEKISGNKFDAVITDIVMPGMDGITLTKKILTLWPDLPIMIMTGYSEIHSVESAIAAGAREFIKKPFSIDEFLLRLSKLMRDHENSNLIKARMLTKHKEFTEKIERLKRDEGNPQGSINRG